ncbi:hypothetical protein Sjap_013092 [Stephania japonica]|uniref:Uncharacterized protein n=1 Tax=Stephania japonica TaxID=461633 RepID=A0AAP0NZJ3_9MAGN
MPNGSFPVVKWNSGSVFDDASSLHATQQPLENGVSSSRSIPITVNLEDKVDDLLAELSSLKHQEGVPPLYTDGKSMGQSSNSSRNVDVTLDLNNTVDDLLAEASNLHEKKGSVVPLQNDAKLTYFTKPSPQSTMKLMDDFNSMLDTIVCLDQKL